jgi:hypothetical protein
MTSTRGWLAVYIFSAAAAVYTHYYALFLLPFHAILIALFVWHSPRQRLFIFLPAIPSALTLVLIPQVLTSMAGNTNVGPTFVPLQTILIDLLNSFSVGVTVNLDQIIWIDLALLFIFIVGVSFPISNLQSPISIFLLVYLIIPVLAVFAASFIRPLYQNSRYLIAISPAFYIGVAAGIVALTRRWQIFLVPTLGIFLIGAILSLNNLYFDPRFGKDDHRGWAASLRDRVRPSDFLILDSPHTEELYRYYADDIVPMTTLPILRAGGDDVTVVRDTLAQYPRVWFLALHVPFDDPQNRIEKILNQQGVLLDQTQFAGTSTDISLSLFARALPVADPKVIAHPLDVAFNGHLHLRGFDAPSSLEPGSHLAVKLYWQIDEPVGEDYAVSVRLVDQTETLVGQWDSVPVGNRSGTSTWERNQIIIDARDLAIAANVPSGKYRLLTVPYHAATRNALGDVVTLTEIEIKCYKIAQRATMKC